MKKTAIVILTGLFVGIPAVASADYVVRSANHYFLYKTTTYSVDTFTDSGNRCYVTTSKLSGYSTGEVTAISCIKQ